MSNQKRRNLAIGCALAIGLGCIGTAVLAWLVMPEPPPPPCVSVVVHSPDRSAEEIETAIAIPIEAALRGPALGSVRAISENGRAIVSVCGSEDTDGIALATQVRERIRDVSLPDDAEPTISRIGEGRAVRWFTVEGAPRETTAEDAIRRVEAQPGVAAVQACGRANVEIAVVLDPARMQALDVTVAEVARALRTSHVDVPAGRIEAPGREVILRASAGDASDIGRTPVGQSGLIAIDDVARVEQSLSSRECLAWRGERTVAAAVLLQHGVADPDGIAAAVDDALRPWVARRSVRLFGQGARVETGRVLSADTDRERMWHLATELGADLRRLSGVRDVLALVDDDGIRIVIAYASPSASEEELRAFLDVVHQQPGLRYLPDDGGVRIRVSGPDHGRALSIASDVRDRLARDPAVLGAHVLDAADRPELATIPDRERAAELGVTAHDLADTLRAATTHGLEVAQFTRGSELLDVVLRLPVASPADSRSLGALTLRSRSGALVPIEHLVRFEQRSTPARLLRVDGVRSIELYAFGDPSEDGPTSLLDAFDALSSQLQLPPGYTVAIEER